MLCAVTGFSGPVLGSAAGVLEEFFGVCYVTWVVPLDPNYCLRPVARRSVECTSVSTPMTGCFTKLTRTPKAGSLV